VKGYRAPGIAEGMERLIEEARALAKDGARVAWITMPSLRDYVLARTAEKGTLLGVEAMHFQALYQRVVGELDPPEGTIDPGQRVAMVAEALIRRDWLRAPGEARIYARALAELKRFGLGPDAVPQGDRESRRLAAIYRDYERARAGRMDPDDVAWRAVALLEDGHRIPLVDALVVGGMEELAPREFRFLKAASLHAGHRVLLSLPEPPEPGFEPLLPLFTKRQDWEAENPVHELRYVLAELKADLLQRGFRPGELALVAPAEKLHQIELLGREYGVPFSNESYRALGDTEDGRRLLDWLMLADRPSGERLFLIPELVPLARAALALGLSGREAIARLAEERGLAEPFAAWMARLDPGGDPLGWAQSLLDGDPLLRESPFRPAFEERAREAYRAAGGRDFVRWWAGFLESVRTKRREPHGVALLTPDAAAGRRYKKAYLVYAASGSWQVGERESYFIPEELRVRWPELFSSGPALPQRFRGRDRRLYRALSSLAAELVVSYPASERGQRLRAEAGLVCHRPKPMPEPRPASAYGLWPKPPPGERYPKLPKPKSLLELERWDERQRCGFRAYLDRLRLPRPEAGAWREDHWSEPYHALRRAKAEGQPPPADALAAFRMTEAEWRALGFRRRVDVSDLPVYAVPAGLRREGKRFLVYRFGGATEEARKAFNGRVNEILAAAELAQRGYTAEVWYWGLGSRPVRVWTLDLNNEKIQQLIQNRKAIAEDLYQAWLQADAAPVPGHACSSCPYADLCRRN